MKHLLSFLFLSALLISCQGQSKPENSKSDTNGEATSLRSNDPAVHTRYEYTNPAGNCLVIENGYPRGGTRYTDSSGDEYAYAIFWTRFINETDSPLSLEIDFSASYEVPSLPGKQFKLSVLPDTMTADNIASFNYGLTSINSFLDKNIHQPSSIKRTIKPKESSGFFVLKMNRVAETEGGGDILRTGLILKGQDLFYKVSRYNSTVARQPPTILSEKEISCGRINLKPGVTGIDNSIPLLNMIMLM